jgi:2-polyprenyl-3-methyl-5-hydroxy-6-metoxy-1,4-benzoquinol methylase
LARLGATVTGVDAGEENIRVAMAALTPDISDRVQFLATTAEDFLKANPTIQFDGVVASEVIEHVGDQKLFIKLMAQLVKVIKDCLCLCCSMHICSKVGIITTMS